MNRLFFFLISCVYFVSCSNEDEEKLRSLVNSDIQITVSDSIKDTEFALAQYEREELELNKIFVSDLERLINSAYDKQLEHFEEEELGFIAGYGHMFSYLFESKQGWEDEMRLKSEKYFGSLNIEQNAYTLFEFYQKDIANLRKRFWNRSNNNILPKHQSLNLPDKRISLGELTSHSRNNIVIEIISEGLEKLGSLLLYPFFVWLLSLFLPNKIITNKIIICGAKILVFIISMAVSVGISMWNDNSLLEELRAQNKEQVTLDYQKILKELNDNTQKFYEND